MHLTYCVGLPTLLADHGTRVDALASKVRAESIHVDKVIVEYLRFNYNCCYDVYFRDLTLQWQRLASTCYDADTASLRVLDVLSAVCRLLHALTRWGLCFGCSSLFLTYGRELY